MRVEQRPGGRAKYVRLWMVGFIVGVGVTTDEIFLVRDDVAVTYRQRSPALCDQGVCWNDPVAEREKASCPARLCRIATSVLGQGLVIALTGGKQVPQRVLQSYDLVS